MNSQNNQAQKISLYFILLAMLFSWPIFFLIDAWIAPSLMAQDFSVKALFLILAGHLTAMFGPALAAIVLTTLVLHQRLPAWNWGRPRHYGYGFLFMASVWLLPALLGLALSSLQFRTSIETFQLIYMGTYIGAAWFASVAEETGWCGFLLPYFSLTFGQTRAVIFSGTLRGVWHYPVLISPFLYKVFIGEHSIFSLLLLSAAFILQLIVSNILFGSLFGYVWFQTRSLPLLGWLHFMFDLFRDFLIFFLIGYGQSFFGKFGWAILFYSAAYLCLERIMRREGIANIFKFIWNRDFFQS